MAMSVRMMFARTKASPGSDFLRLTPCPSRCEPSTLEGQEDQLGALDLVLNAALLWTTRHLDAAVTALRALPADQREHEVLTRTSPACLPSSTRTSTAWAATASAPPSRLSGTCAPCATPLLRTRTRISGETEYGGQHLPRRASQPRAHCSVIK